MYRRRRVGTLLSVTRRHDDTRTPTDPVHIFNSSSTDLNEFRTNSDFSPTNNRAVGASFLSSSSSSTTSSTNSSRSSSPSRTASLHSMPNRQSQTHLTSSRRQRTRASRNSFRLDSTDSTLPTHSLASSSFTRCAAPVSSKAVTRSRRRTLLRSPIFQLILSPETNQNDSRSQELPNQNDNQLQTDFPLIDNFLSVHPEVPDFRLGSNGGGVANGPARSVRSRARTHRANSTARIRSSINTRSDSASATATRNIPRPIEHRSQNSQESVDVRAAVAVVRSTNPDNEDDCVICLCEKSNRSVILPCMHTFCFDCIYRWLCINPSCPLCKRIAQRIIHSVLSDSEFTELLVSDLPNHSRHNRTPELNFDHLDAHLTAAPDDTTSVRTNTTASINARSLSSVFLNQFRDLTNYRSRQNDSSFLLRQLLSTAQPASVTDLLDLADGLSYRWNPGIRDLTEYSHNLLIWLVNSAFPPRESSLLDHLLLRQLVYVFCLDAIPAQQDSSLIRDTSPSFLASNESQRHRLVPFLRRELRVLAPWLAYENAHHSSIHENPEFASPPVTAPLLSGAPGLEADTLQLDDLVNSLVQHFCNVDISNSRALVNFLSEHPAFHPSLVPEAYLDHFATEVLRFAQFSGSMEEYDSSVCLYRRNLTLGSLIHSNSTTSNNNRRGARNRNPATLPSQTSNPHLAVYVASSCWPGFRPGFAQPQGLITHPLVNWLLQRLFVHTVSGSSHPSSLPGTGQQPAQRTDSLTFNPLPVVCHPNCLNLSRLSRALLEAIPPCSRSRSRSFQRNQTNSSMTNPELYPNRLLCQRVLSELIDQARYSEALSAYFSSYNQDDLSSRHSATDTRTDYSSNQDARDFGSNESPSERLRRTLQPAISSHHSALRRLNGLLLLFITRIPGLNVDSDDFISELLHMPLLSMGAPSPTPSDPVPRHNPRSTSGTFCSSAGLRNRPVRDERNRSNFARFDGMDWNFLRRLSPLLSGNSELTTSRSSNSVFPQIERDEIAFNTPETEPGDRLSLSSNASFTSFSSVSTHPWRDRSHIVGNSADEPVLIPDSPNRSWRGCSACVVISSDSSDGETSDATRSCSAAARSNILTSDESDSTPQFSLSIDAENVCANDFVPTSSSLSSNCPSTARSSTESSCKRDSLTNLVEKTSNCTDATLGSNPQISINVSDESVKNSPRLDPPDSLLEPVLARHEEPMEIDEGTLERTTVLDGSSSNTVGGQGLIDALKPYLERSPNLNSTDQSSIRPRESLRSYLNVVESRSSFNARRHRLHSCARSRSPICVETSDSDCEVVHESIRVESNTSDSSSSCSTSSSSRSSSPSSHTSKCSSPSKSSQSSHVNRHRKRSKRHCSHKRKRCQYKTHTHRRARHKKRKCSCHCHSKHQHSRHSPRNHVHKNNGLVLPESPILFNRPSSPIVISDDDDDDDVNETSSPTNQSAACMVSSCKSQNVLQRSESGSERTAVVANSPTNLTIIPSTSNSHPDAESFTSKPGSSHPANSTSMELHDPVPKPSSSSSMVSFPIFEPPTVEDFYQFMDRFHTPESDMDQTTPCTSRLVNPNPTESRSSNVELPDQTILDHNTSPSSKCLSQSDNPGPFNLESTQQTNNTELSKPVDFQLSCSLSCSTISQANPEPVNPQAQDISSCQCSSLLNNITTSEQLDNASPIE